MAEVGAGQGLMMSNAPLRFAVLGSPIAHSLSPVLHRTAYRTLGIENASYDRFEVPSGRLAQFLASDEGRVLDGASVTMPGKAEAFALAEDADETAKVLGNANTLLRRSDGSWRAENHDVHGIVAALREHGVEVAERIGILGSGATAASALVAAERLGAQEVRVTARSAEKLRGVHALGRSLGLRIEQVGWGESDRVLRSPVVISALALPGAEAAVAAWDARGIEQTPEVVLDALYDPWPPPFAHWVQARGGTVVGGLDMLVHQADMQLRSMLGIDRAPLAPMRDVALRVLRERGRDGS